MSATGRLFRSTVTVPFPLWLLAAMSLWAWCVAVDDLAAALARVKGETP